jgi:hypothetical protein
MSDGTIRPESPERLRECLSALAEHQDAHVLRVEVVLGLASDDQAQGALKMIITHSLGEEWEKAIGPSLAAAFGAAVNAMAGKLAGQAGGDPT